VKKGFLDHKKGDLNFFLNKKIYDISKKIILKEGIYFISDRAINEIWNKLKEETFLFKIENSNLKIVSSSKKRDVYSNFPIHATSFGKVILSYLDKEESEKIIKNLDLEKFTIYTKVDLEEIRKELKRIKKDGYSISIEEYIYGFFDISVPILDRVRKKIYSLGVILSKTKLSESFLPNLLKNLKEEKKKIEKDLYNIYKFI